MSTTTSSEPSHLPVVSDGIRLSCGIRLPHVPRGVVLLLHGTPSTYPPDPSDPGYPGWAGEFSRRGWAAAWGGMRNAHGSPGPFSIEGWVRDAGAMLAAARAATGRADLPAAVVGCSAGGAVAAELARRDASVDALVLLAAPATWGSFASDPPALVQAVLETGMTLPQHAVLDPSQWAAEFLEVTTERSITAVRVPVLILQGSEDETVPAQEARRIAAKAPNAYLKILDGAGHQLRREPRVTPIVLEWLDDVLGAGTGR